MEEVRLKGLLMLLVLAGGIFLCKVWIELIPFFSQVRARLVKSKPIKAHRKRKKKKKRPT
ncbi:hypothetical protein COU76_04010 [Candidatus Peregrinibacteria bacterium CG10_big_fil_rev_8_21_14_0_10_49_10]|nr:MAG: hypothetical protein COU76_04010 [Candidatus Peregrinibacteria bacterium CG10_big_fil_rev_8_21_14_0_10_49_10]